MTDTARRITLDEWDLRYAELRAKGLREPDYGGPLRRHVSDGDLRLQKLHMDNSAAALRLWNFFLSEEDRLHRCVAQGKKLVGTMKDLGTVPVMAYSFSNLVAFYPDGAWWLPCVMQCSTGLLEIADSLGIDDSFCPVRDAGCICKGRGLPAARTDYLQRGGYLRRFFGNCPAFGVTGISDHVVGNPASPPAGGVRGGRRASRRVCRARQPGGFCEIGTPAGSAGIGGIFRRKIIRAAAFGGD